MRFFVRMEYGFKFTYHLITTRSIQFFPELLRVGDQSLKSLNAIHPYNLTLRKQRINLFPDKDSRDKRIYFVEYPDDSLLLPCISVSHIFVKTEVK